MLGQEGGEQEEKVLWREEEEEETGTTVCHLLLEVDQMTDSIAPGGGKGRLALVNKSKLGKNQKS